MDMIAIDLTDHPDAVVGDPVLLWGEDLPVETVAQAAGTIAYELLCGLTGRVHVELRDEPREP
jgi:alanine racemase